MTVKIIENTVTIPEDITIDMDGNKISVTGTNGKVERDFGHSKLNMKHIDNTLHIWTMNPKKKEASLVNTITSHIQNMIKGVQKGFIYRLKIVFIHFPMTIQVEKNKVVINNFVGEQAPRVAKIQGNVKIHVEGDDIVVQGANIEDVAQTAANIQQSTHIKNKDLRKFLDGIYIYRKE
jgi:large subunit ribosomal protein L6